MDPSLNKKLGLINQKLCFLYITFYVFAGVKMLDNTPPPPPGDLSHWYRTWGNMKNGKLKRGKCEQKRKKGEG